MHPEKRAGRDIEAWKKSAILMLRSANSGPPFNGPVRLSLVFVVQRPATRPTVAKTVIRNGVKMPNPRYEGGHFIVTKEAWATGARVLSPSKPDLDRLVNAIKDVITAAGIWWDDSQAATYGSISKWYADIGEDPSIYIKVESV